MELTSKRESNSNIIIIGLVDYGLHVIQSHHLSTSSLYLTCLNLLCHRYELFFYQSHYNNIILCQAYHHHTHGTSSLNCFETRVTIKPTYQTNKACKSNIRYMVHFYGHHPIQADCKRDVKCQTIKESI